MGSEVTFTRQEVIDYQDVWQTVQDACQGQEAMKQGGTRYLPMPNAFDKSDKNKERYKAYVERAVYYNAAGRTMSALTGLLFSTPPEVELDPVIDYMNREAAGDGNSLEQMLQEASRTLLLQGRSGILVDFSSAEINRSKADTSARATLSLYKPENIINWRFKTIGNQQYLTLVVLREVEEVEKGDFELEEKTTYRELRLTDEGYVIRVWEDYDGSFEITEIYEPTKSDGSRWKEIPFKFLGSYTNTPSFDPIPMYDLAVLNIAHWRNSADYEESAFLVGQPQPWLSGLTMEWRDTLQESGLYLGSRSPWLLPEGGQAGLLQANENTLSRQAMMDKEEQMATIGARLVTRTPQYKTARESASDDDKTTNTLQLIANNLSSGFRDALDWASEMMGGGSNYLKVNSDFMPTKINDQTLRALIEAVQGGVMPACDLWSQMRRAGYIEPYRKNEQVREAIKKDRDLVQFLNDIQNSGEAGNSES